MQTANLIAREEKFWWAVSEESVQYARGLTCAPNNPGHWWVPTLGFTMMEGHHLFPTEKEALRKLEADIAERIAGHHRDIARLEGILPKLRASILTP